MTISGKVRALMAALIFLWATACAATPPLGSNAPPATTSTIEAAQRVYVMRHLWRGEGADPDLTPRGAEAASRLAKQLGASRIKAVFATAKRAHQTAAPLAAGLGVAVTTYDPRDIDAVARAVDQVGGNVLVVGHSNTVPALVARFGGISPPPLGEHDYGAIYRIDVSSNVIRVFDIDKPDAALAE